MRNKASKSKEPSTRQLRVGELVRQSLAAAVQRSEAEVITITEVRMTPDLKSARVFIMPLGGDMGINMGGGDNIAAAVERLNENAARYKASLGDLRLRFIPQLFFVADTSFDNGAKIDRLLATLPPSKTTNSQD